MTAPSSHLASAMSPSAAVAPASTLEAELYSAVADAPIVSPHGHVDPALFSDPATRFSDPAALLVTPDHYLVRMFYSQGIALEALGIHQPGDQRVTEPRDIWRTFASNFHLFRATPSAQWITLELREIFGVHDKLSAETADQTFDQVSTCLAADEFAPRVLHDRLNIEVLCTTDSATDSLHHHQKIAESDWDAKILPTFRPDDLIAIERPGWLGELSQLEEASGQSVGGFVEYIAALENRRDYFRANGAVATDHGVATPYTEILSAAQAQRIFASALAGTVTTGDAERFRGHMMCEMARMSCEDGLVMQMHAGVYRDHNPWLHENYGSNLGADIPIKAEFTHNLAPLLHAYGNDQRLRLVLFSLDESPYARELAPLAGHYPALRVGPPWWFHDSWNGIARYLDQVLETAGLYNTAGFNDDTRAYPSIPARHAVWRRGCARWLSQLVADQRLDEPDAFEMIEAMANGLARETYRLTDHD